MNQSTDRFRLLMFFILKLLLFITLVAFKQYQPERVLALARELNFQNFSAMCLSTIDDDLFMLGVISLLDKMQHLSIEQIYISNIHYNNTV
jgi:hypothetical protein